MDYAKELYLEEILLPVVLCDHLNAFSPVVAWLWYRSDRAREDRSHVPLPPPLPIMSDPLTTPAGQRIKAKEND